MELRILAWSLPGRRDQREFFLRRGSIFKAIVCFILLQSNFLLLLNYNDRIRMGDSLDPFSLHFALLRMTGLPQFS